MIVTAYGQGLGDDMRAAARDLRRGCPAIYGAINVDDLSSPFIVIALAYLAEATASPTTEAEYKEQRWTGLPEITDAVLLAALNGPGGQRRDLDHYAQWAIEEMREALAAALKVMAGPSPEDLSRMHAGVMDDSGTEPSPEMREVPAEEPFEAGDTITIVGVAGNDPGWSVMAGPGRSVTEVVLRNLAGPVGVTVSRPASPLPDKPGAVGTAEVRGGPLRIQVHRLPSVVCPGKPWVALVGGAFARFGDSDLSDYVPLLDGQGGL